MLGKFVKSVESAMKTPGENLMGRDLIAYRAIVASYDKAVNCMLLRPDWDANLQCGEKVNSATPLVMSEFVFMMRKHINSTRDLGILKFILLLIDFLVKNGNPRFWKALNSDGGDFMESLGKLARKYSKETSSQTREVSELVLDIIQAWGEGFLPQSQLYPEMPKMYHQLRKEGIRFKPQYDPSRVPIFTPPENEAGRDAPLANSADAVLAASLGLGQESHIQRRSMSSSSPSNGKSGAAATAAAARAFDKLNRPHAAVIEMQTSLQLMQEMISATISKDEIVSNDFLPEIASNVMKLQNTVIAAIEEMSTSSPEDIEIIFALNEEATQTFEALRDLKEGKLSFEEMKSSLFSPLSTTETSVKETEVPASSSTANVDILDLGFGDMTVTPAAPITNTSTSNLNSEPSSGDDALNFLMGSASVPTPAMIPAGVSDPTSVPTSVTPQVALASTLVNETAGSGIVSIAPPIAAPSRPRSIPKLKAPKSDAGRQPFVIPPPSSTSNTPAPAPIAEPMDDLLSMLGTPSAHNNYQLPPTGQPETNQTRMPQAQTPPNIFDQVANAQHQQQQPQKPSSDNPFDIF
jgi:hypothetical protein